jgi:hypothetical protein
VALIHGAIVTRMSPYNMPQKPSVPRVCENPACKKSFLARPVDVKRGLMRFCSVSCASKIARHPPVASGANNPRWRGGETRSSKGYWYVKMPDHPRAMKSGYVKRADLVLEKKLGRPLEPNEIAHHMDENKDNDSPDNLEPMDGDVHRTMHSRERGALRRVPKKPPQPNHPSNRRYSWPTNEELVRMHETMSLRKIAAQIGCSWKAVDRRLRRIHSSSSCRKQASVS